MFFARPYHSWERGANENINGLIRRLYSRQSSFAGIGEVELDHIERFLNDRPRKRLGWKTPREEMSGFPCFRPLKSGAEKNSSTLGRVCALAPSGTGTASCQGKAAPTRADFACVSSLCVALARSTGNTRSKGFRAGCQCCAGYWLSRGTKGK